MIYKFIKKGSSLNYSLVSRYESIIDCLDENEHLKISTNQLSSIGYFHYMIRPITINLDIDDLGNFTNVSKNENGEIKISKQMDKNEDIYYINEDKISNIKNQEVLGVWNSYSRDSKIDSLNLHDCQ